jgi:hypothetical protein
LDEGGDHLEGVELVVAEGVGVDLGVRGEEACHALGHELLDRVTHLAGCAREGVSERV